MKRRRRGHASGAKRITRGMARVVMDVRAGRSVDVVWDGDAARAAETGLIVWDGAGWLPSEAGLAAVAEEEKKRVHDRAVARQGAAGRRAAMGSVGMRRTRSGGWE